MSKQNEHLEAAKAAYEKMSAESRKRYGCVFKGSYKGADIHKIGPTVVGEVQNEHHYENVGQTNPGNTYDKLDRNSIEPANTYESLKADGQYEKVEQIKPVYHYGQRKVDAGDSDGLLYQALYQAPGLIDPYQQNAQNKVSNKLREATSRKTEERVYSIAKAAAHKN